jgi:tetratricopeptide (TPR) repeat protein
VVLLGGLILAPGLWWRWRTREFRRGMRALRRGDLEASRARFEVFLEDVEQGGRFLRYQPFFNLGRPYDYVAAARNNLGVIALRSGDRAGAVRAFDSAAERAPNFAPAHYGRAAVRLLAGDLEGAESAAREGLRGQPGHRPCAILAALCRAERGDRAGAEELLGGLRKPVDWDRARAFWAKLYRFWGEDEAAARWE